MIQPRLLDAKRKPFVVYCQDGEALTKGTLVARGGGGVLFEPELLGDGASPPVRPGGAQRGRLLDANREPFIVNVDYGEATDVGTLVVRPGGVVLFEQRINTEVDEAESRKEDERQARRQARQEGVDPRQAAPA